MNSTRSRRTSKGKTFLFVNAPATGLEARTHPPGHRGWPTRSGVPAGGHTPPLGPRARPPAGVPRPHLLPLPHPRGRAPRSAARLPGSRRAAATAAPARQPAPRRAHGARAPHFLSPKPRPADHSPGQSPAAAVTGKAWRWDQPAGSAAQRNRAGAGVAGGRTDERTGTGRAAGAAERRGPGVPPPGSGGRADPGRRRRPVTSESWNAGGGARGRCGQLRPAAGEGARRCFF